MIEIPTRELVQAWTELQSLVPMSAIQSEEQYDRSVETLDALLDLVGDDESHPLYDLLDTLGTLIESYEETHYPIPPVTGVDVLKFLLEEHNLTLDDLPEIGTAADVSQVLAGKRELSIPEIRVLAKRFGVSPAVFIEPE